MTVFSEIQFCLLSNAEQLLQKLLSMLKNISLLYTVVILFTHGNCIEINVTNFVAEDMLNSTGGINQDYQKVILEILFNGTKYITSKLTTTTTTTTQNPYENYDYIDFGFLNNSKKVSRSFINIAT